MVAYNFQERFAPLIESGKKCQTIRRIGKRRHARCDEPIQLYTGMRTQACRKIIEPDPVCVMTEPIKVFTRGLAFRVPRTEDLWRLLDVDLDDAAREDGFVGWDEMRSWFSSTHGLPFVGLLIRWGRG